MQAHARPVAVNSRPRDPSALSAIQLQADANYQGPVLPIASRPAWDAGRGLS